MDYIKYKRVEGYEDYIIFTTGKIYSTKRNIFMKHNIITDKRNNYKRSIVKLRDGKRQKTYGFHRLLALAFIPNHNNLPTVDHININSLDNRLSNLRWASQQKQNINQNIQKNNTTGYKGIYLRKKKSIYVADWYENKKRKTKSFAIRKYGKEEALRLAIKYRQQMVEKHYSNIV